MRYLIEQNVAALRQTRLLLSSITAEQYVRPVESCFGSTLGGHVRHLLDHYSSYFKSGSEGWIDYETRERDQRLETDPLFAIAVTDETMRLLGVHAEDEGGHHLAVRVEHLNEGDPGFVAPSSYRRELLFLLSHTVHHCALISVCCHSMGIRTPSGFGVAPSTLRHRETQQAARA
ncbi:MAG: DinB family protein [Opitutaceae bacterium]|nr:DinB family protein [Opitutaceae bacterium]